MRNCAEYEYEPKSVFGTGQASPLQHVKIRTQRPLGLLAARERSKSMPKVGEKHFSYTKKGQQAAKAEAKRTGKPITKKGK